MSLVNWTMTHPQWDTEDAEIKVASVENPEMTNVLPFVKHV